MSTRATYRFSAECSWCGSDLLAEFDGKGELIHVCKSRRDEYFCSRAHRDASSRAVKRLLDRTY